MVRFDVGTGKGSLHVDFVICQKYKAPVPIIGFIKYLNNSDHVAKLPISNAKIAYQTLILSLILTL